MQTLLSPNSNHKKGLSAQGRIDWSNIDAVVRSHKSAKIKKLRQAMLSRNTSAVWFRSLQRKSSLFLQYCCLFVFNNMNVEVFYFVLAYVNLSMMMCCFTIEQDQSCQADRLMKRILLLLFLRQSIKCLTDQHVLIKKYEHLIL